MKKTVAIMAGLALTGSMASLAQAQETQEYDPNQDIATETEQDRTTGMGETQQDTPTQSEYGTESETQTEMGTDPYGTESQTQTTDPYGTETETQTQTDPYGTETETQTETYGAETGSEMGQDVTAMTSEELQGKTIVTETGEEIGSINQVGYSSTHQERVATVEVGGFLGVGQKTIAVPLTDLQSGQEEDQLKTSMTRESIESQQEFDESQLTADEQQQ